MFVHIVQKSQYNSSFCRISLFIGERCSFALNGFYILIRVYRNATLAWDRSNVGLPEDQMHLIMISEWSQKCLKFIPSTQAQSLWTQALMPGTHRQICIVQPNGLNEKKTWGACCINCAMLVQQSPLWAIVFWQGDSPSPEHTGQHSQQFAVSADWMPISCWFPACPFDRSWTLGQLLSDQLLYTLAECQLVSVDLADTGRYSAHV